MMASAMARADGMQNGGRLIERFGASNVVSEVGTPSKACPAKLTDVVWLDDSGMGCSSISMV
jgi:hypothetical protein